MKIFVTGGNGFLGRNLILELQKRGDSVVVLALPAEDTIWLEKRGVRVLRGDLRNPAVLTEGMHGVDAVFHLAAMMGAWRPMQVYYEVNVTGTENVCRATLANGVRRIIHVSSAMVYNMASGRPITEKDRLNPLDEPYSMTKALGDRLVQRMIVKDHLPAVIIRPSTIFGINDPLNFGRIADRISAGKAIIIGSGENTVPFVYVTDVVQGLLLAMDHPHAEGQIYNIGNDKALNQKALFSAIAQEIGAIQPHIHVPYYPLYAAAYTAERLSTLSGCRIAPFVTRHGVKLYGADNLLSIDKARRDLGYEPQVSIREGIQGAAAWYLRQHTWVQGEEQVSVSTTVKAKLVSILNRS
jgi:nucleoside-diphosphate-sugar epimerase